MTSPIGLLDLSGGPIPARFKEVWLADFEFRAEGGERPLVRCMVAAEFYTKRVIRMWANELCNLRRAPFDTGPCALFVAYYVPAEMSCFLQLGWEMPRYVLDLYCEHRVETNGLLEPSIKVKGKKKESRDSLPQALEYRGLPHIDVAEKDTMRSMARFQETFTPEQQRALLDYCESDVRGLEVLLPVMAPTIDWRRALFRGEFMKANAKVVHNGVPIDTDLLLRLERNWSQMQTGIIRSLPPDCDVYVDDSFSESRFMAWCDRKGIQWRMLESGRPDLDKSTFKDMAGLDPDIGRIKEVRSSLGKMRLSSLAVGPDGRNRTLLSSFGSITARNQPSNSKSVFGTAKWMRGLIRPVEGQALAYLDFSSQEVAIAASLSADEQMLDDYASGDPYMRFAIASRLAPEDATRVTHEPTRNTCKTYLLASLYGQSAHGLARRTNLPQWRAQGILNRLRDRYSTFWQWRQDTADRAQFDGVMHTCLGWRRRIPPYQDYKARSVVNWPIQSCGAELMRLVVVAAVDAGIELCMPVHDGFLIAGPLNRIADDVERMRTIMHRAALALNRGVAIRVDAKVIPSPDRYMDKEGRHMWGVVTQLLAGLE